MKKNIWPYAIIAYFVVFITGIATWVSFAMRHDDQLVRPDYYEHEMKYQSQIDRITRTRALNGEAIITYNPVEKNIRIALPAEMCRQKLQGTIHLYRPSDARLDQKISLAPAIDGSQQINVSQLQSGLWRLRLNWNTDGDEYYFEKPVVLLGP